METRDKISIRITKLEKNVYKLMDLLELYNKEITGDDNPADLSVQKKYLHHWGVTRAKEMAYEALDKIEEKKLKNKFGN